MTHEFLNLFWKWKVSTLQQSLGLNTFDMSHLDRGGNFSWNDCDSYLWIWTQDYQQTLPFWLHLAVKPPFSRHNFIHFSHFTSCYVSSTHVTCHLVQFYNTPPHMFEAFLSHKLLAKSYPKCFLIENVYDNINYRETWWKWLWIHCILNSLMHPYHIRL